MNATSTLRPERQLAELGRRAVGDDVAGRHLVADLHQRPLVDAGVLVRTLELQQVVDVDARGRGRGLLGRPDDDAGRVDLVDHAAAPRDDRRRRSRARRVSSMPVPTSGASARISGTAWRCMFEPISARLASSFSRNGISAAATETSCFGDTSIRSMSSGRAHHEIAAVPAADQVLGEAAVGVERARWPGRSCTCPRPSPRCRRPRR